MMKTVMTTNPDVNVSEDFRGIDAAGASARTETVLYFIFAVLGFSFWFFIAVPFATHREAYSWLATVGSHPFAYAFLNHMSVTYRPLGQAAGWLGVLLLKPKVFPTSVLRQTLLQGFVYGTFLLGWWLVYRAAPQRRLFALVAFVAGAVFFSGYVHLFHIYGIMYTPVILVLGALLLSHASATFDRHEVLFAVVAILLALWHPFATALFVGFYFGFCLETSRQRSRGQWVRALLIMLVALTSTLAFGVFFARHDAAAMSLHTRVLGFVVSYRTNEINLAASMVAFLMAVVAVFSMEFSKREKWLAVLGLSVVATVFLVLHLPVLLLFLFTVLIKLLWLRSWSLFFLVLTATLLPFGGGIGAPVFALFAIIGAVYATCLGWLQAEKALRCMKPRYIEAVILAAAMVVVLVRVGIKLPVVTRVATPLLAERERTYQLEHTLAWLHNSDYCSYEVSFAADARSPIYDVQGAITRLHRAPASLEDVQRFWNTVLRCQSGSDPDPAERVATVTFGGPVPADSQVVFEIRGVYADVAEVSVPGSRKTDTLGR
jgi:hypothetical protein